MMKRWNWIRFRRGASGMRFCLGIVVTLGTAACAPPPEPKFTVKYYRENPASREAQLEACNNDPGRLGQTVYCINAREAAQIEGVGSLRDLPAMGLPAPHKSK